MNDNVKRTKVTVALLIISIVFVNTFTAIVLSKHIIVESDKKGSESTEAITDVQGDFDEYPSDVYLFGAPDRIVITYDDKSEILAKGSDDYEFLLLQNEYRKEHMTEILFNSVPSEALNDYLDKNEFDYVDPVTIDYYYDTGHTFSAKINYEHSDSKAEAYDGGIKETRFKAERIRFYLDLGEECYDPYFVVYEKDSEYVLTGLWSNACIPDTIREILNKNN